MASYQGQTSKPTRTMVKPILRKLAYSEKNSLDLERPVEELDAFGIYGYGYGGNGAGGGNASPHDIVFNNHPARRGYHTRSTSGTSQFSTATTGSGARAGSFVHPFQQTPRPYTPPLVTTSHQPSVRDPETSHKDSPAHAEDEDHVRRIFRANSSLSTRSPSYTSAMGVDVGSQPLRIQTTRHSSASRVALSTSHVSLSNSIAYSPDMTSPSEVMSPTSTLRTSIDKGFRLRSRSEVDTRERAECIQEARRKFQEKETAKDEKAAQDEIRALEKRNQKEARKAEREHRRSSASDATRSKRSRSVSTTQEKDHGITGQAYDRTRLQTPIVEDEMERPRRSHAGFSGTKKRTHGSWTKFMMWLRTRFIRMGVS